jgi:hypothetical protein
MDIRLEDKPRGVLMNAVFGMLLYPGLVREEGKRWREVLYAVHETRKKTWTHTYKMCLFLDEVVRIGEKALEEIKEEEEIAKGKETEKGNEKGKEKASSRGRKSLKALSPSPPPLGAERETKAFNNVLGVVNYARLLNMPHNLLPPSDGNLSPLYDYVKMRPKTSGDKESFPISVGGEQISGYVFSPLGEKEDGEGTSLGSGKKGGVRGGGRAKASVREGSEADGELITQRLKYVALNLDNLEVLGVFQSESNASSFIAALNSEKELYMGKDSLEMEAERQRVTKGRYDDPGLLKFPEPVVPMTLEEQRAVLGRIWRKEYLSGDSPDFTIFDEIRLKYMRESGEWRRKYRPVTFDYLPEEMKLGEDTLIGAPGVILKTRTEELCPQKMKLNPTCLADGPLPKIKLVDLDHDPMIFAWERSASEEIELLEEERNKRIASYLNRRPTEDHFSSSPSGTKPKSPYDRPYLRGIYPDLTEPQMDQLIDSLKMADAIHPDLKKAEEIVKREVQKNWITAEEFLRRLDSHPFYGKEPHVLLGGEALRNYMEKTGAGNLETPPEGRGESPRPSGEEATKEEREEDGSCEREREKESERSPEGTERSQEGGGRDFASKDPLREYLSESLKGAKHLKPEGDMEEPKSSEDEEEGRGPGPRT